MKSEQNIVIILCIHIIISYISKYVMYILGRLCVPKVYLKYM